MNPVIEQLQEYGRYADEVLPWADLDDLTAAAESGPSPHAEASGRSTIYRRVFTAAAVVAVLAVGATLIYRAFDTDEAAPEGVEVIDAPDVSDPLQTVEPVPAPVAEEGAAEVVPIEPQALPEPAATEVIASGSVSTSAGELAWSHLSATSLEQLSDVPLFSYGFNFDFPHGTARWPDGRMARLGAGIDDQVGLWLSEAGISWAPYSLPEIGDGVFTGLWNATSEDDSVWLSSSGAPRIWATADGEAWHPIEASVVAPEIEGLDWRFSTGGPVVAGSDRYLEIGARAMIPFPSYLGDSERGSLSVAVGDFSDDGILELFDLEAEVGTVYGYLAVEKTADGVVFSDVESGAVVGEITGPNPDVIFGRVVGGQQQWGSDQQWARIGPDLVMELREYPFSGPLRDLYDFDGQLFAVVDTPEGRAVTWHSTDGVTWQESEPPPGRIDGPFGVMDYPGRAALVGEIYNEEGPGDFGAVSFDGLTWEESLFPEEDGLVAVLASGWLNTRSGGEMAEAPQSLWVSPDRIEWQEVSLADLGLDPRPDRWYSLAEVGDNTAIITAHTGDEPDQVLTDVWVLTLG